MKTPDAVCRGRTSTCLPAAPADVLQLARTHPAPQRRHSHELHTHSCRQVLRWSVDHRLNSSNDPTYAPTVGRLKALHPADHCHGHNSQPRQAVADAVQFGCEGYGFDPTTISPVLVDSTTPVTPEPPSARVTGNPSNQGESRFGSPATISRLMPVAAAGCSTSMRPGN
jgi:hypothetical protein